MTPATLLSLAQRCETEQGSQWLDADIHKALGFSSDRPSWHTRIPSYSTSLDAKLPGEDIRFVESGLLAECRYSAAQLTRDGLIWSELALTEPLARRAARLRAMAAELETPPR